jgi:outer membrane protein TolC
LGVRGAVSAQAADRRRPRALSSRRGGLSAVNLSAARLAGAALTALFTLALVFPTQANAQAQPSTITLDEAIAEATGEHPSIAQARAEHRAAEAERKQARAAFGPTLSAAAGVQLWNDEIVFSMGAGGEAAPQLPPPQTPYEEVVAGLFADSEPTVIRSQVTADISLTLTQPLGPLWSIYHGYKAAQIGEEAAEVQVDQATRDQAREAAVAYFQVLQAQAVLETAEQSVEQLEAQVEQIRALVDAGVVNRADMLRIEVALASARQQVIQATSRVRLARANLAVAIGLDPQEAVGAESVGQVSLPALEGTPEEAVDAAIAARPELRQLQLRIEQAQEGVEAQRGAYIPQLVALGQVAHAEGQGLTGSDTAFVGLSLNWNIWEWGADYYAVDAAEAGVVGLEATYVQSRRQVGLQVKMAWYDLQSAVEGYVVAQRAVAQAEEAFRVESVRAEAGQSTSTDLLDAEAALTEARNNRNNALYQALIQNTELIYATGRPVTADRLLGGGIQ